jgi:hypothetical protein
MNLLDRHLMDGSFDLAETLKHRFRPFPARPRQRGLVDKVEYLAKAPVRVSRLMAVVMIT